MEGDYEASPNGAPLILFGLPSNEEQRVDYAVEIPKLASLILKHDAERAAAGPRRISARRWPPVPIVFWSFRIMVGARLCDAGPRAVEPRRALARQTVRLALAAPRRDCDGAGGLRRRDRRLGDDRGRPPALDDLWPAAHRRQSHSPLAAPAVATSLLAFVIVYFLVFGGRHLVRAQADGASAQRGEREPRRTPRRAAGITPGLGGSISTRRRGAAMSYDYDLATIWAVIIALRCSPMS